MLNAVNARAQHERNPTAISQLFPPTRARRRVAKALLGSPLGLFRYAAGVMRSNAMAKPVERTRQRLWQRTRTGVDVTLIRWMVRLTPTQRLAVLQDHIKLVTALRRAATTD